MTDDTDRKTEIVEALQAIFADLMEEAPDAFRTKFRKMARDPFAFYRGTAGLFYQDLSGETGLGPELAGDDSRWWGEHGDRVWIQGDLHAENFGTYMSGDGRLVFDVNDFDEAYVAPWTWEIRRFVASLALICWSKALPDSTIDELVETYVRSYVDQVRAFTEIEEIDWALTLDNAEGAVLETLQTAKIQSREAFLGEVSVVENFVRRFIDIYGSRPGEEDRSVIAESFADYQGTLVIDADRPQTRFDVLDTVRLGALGIGSAGLPAYSVLIEGESQALGNDIIITLKQGQEAALSRVITDDRIRDSFDHHGHRTAISQRALQAHASPYLGWAEIGGTGFVVSEFSPYQSDLSWDDLTEPEEMTAVVRQLGRATAKIHCVADDSSAHDLTGVAVEQVVSQGVGDDLDDLVAQLQRFAHDYAGQVRIDHRLFVNAFRDGAFSTVAPLAD